MGFVLFGPYATTQGNVLEILKSGNFTKDGGQVEARNKNKIQKDKERSKDAVHNTCDLTGSESPFKRGIGLENRHKLAVLEQAGKKIGQRDDENQAFILAELIKTGIATTDQCFKIAIRFGKNAAGEEDKKHPMWVAYFELMKDVKALRQKLCVLKEEMRNETTKAAAKRSLAAGLLGHVENAKHKKIVPNKKAKATDTTTSDPTHSYSLESWSRINIRKDSTAPAPPLEIPIGVSQDVATTSSPNVSPLESI